MFNIFQPPSKWSAKKTKNKNSSKQPLQLDFPKHHSPLQLRPTLGSQAKRVASATDLEESSSSIDPCSEEFQGFHDVSWMVCGVLEVVCMVFSWNWCFSFFPNWMLLDVTGFIYNFEHETNVTHRSAMFHFMSFESLIGLVPIC